MVQWWIAVRAVCFALYTSISKVAKSKMNIFPPVCDWDNIYLFKSKMNIFPPVCDWTFSGSYRYANNQTVCKKAPEISYLERFSYWWWSAWWGYCSLTEPWYPNPPLQPSSCAQAHLCLWWEQPEAPGQGNLFIGSGRLSPAGASCNCLTLTGQGKIIDMTLIILIANKFSGVWFVPPLHFPRVQ